MTFQDRVATSGSNPDFVADQVSEQKLSTRRGYEKRKNWKKRKFPNITPVIEAGRGMSNFQNLVLDPLFVEVCSRDSETGDRMEARNRGTRCKYRHTFEQDGSLRKPHKLGFFHIVIIPNFRKSVIKNC